uniref:Uncharacterized protein n=1 Tax=Trichuris muris TaxID=70415 RepID=A0A5S6PZI0_TRIMR
MRFYPVPGNPIFYHNERYRVAEFLISTKLKEISFGGIAMQSDTLDAKQLLDMTRHIQVTLRIHGIPGDILPRVSGEHGVMPTNADSQHQGRSDCRRRSRSS